MNITIRKFGLLSWFIFLLFFLQNKIEAQDKKLIVFVASDQDSEVLNRYIGKRTFTDSVSALKLSQNIIQNLHSKGYLTAAVDSLIYTDSVSTVFLRIGEQFLWAKLDPGNVDERILLESGYKKEYFEKKIFYFPEVSQLFDKVIKYSENHGYPFASVKLDSISIDKNHISAKIHFQEGPFITFDSLAILGSSKIRKKFLANYLKIVQGQPYEEANFREISSKLKRLSYISLIEAPEVTFQNNEATIYLHVEDKKVNQIDGIIGFFPNAGNDEKLLLTGQFNLFLQNMFGTGKALHLEWQKIKPLSQLLNISYFHPNVFSSPLNLGSSFYLLKEDTTFLNRDAGITFSINKGLYSDIRLYTKIRTANLLSSNQYKDNNVLPDYADFILHSYGLGYQWSNLNDPFFPSSGLIVEIDGSIGNKKITKNGSLPRELYDGVPERSLQINMSTGISKYTQVTKRIVILNSVKAGFIDNDKLFLNDLFRIGGLQTLRGFNENFFFASQFLTATGEVRMMLDQQSFFLLFVDQGFLKYNITSKEFVDTPTGFGLGLNLALEGGIFNFVYALGGAKAQPMNFQGSKIHFGYISRF